MEWLKHYYWRELRVGCGRGKIIVRGTVPVHTFCVGFLGFVDYDQPRLDSDLHSCLLTAYVGLLGVLAADCRAGETPLSRPVLG